MHSSLRKEPTYRNPPQECISPINVKQSFLTISTQRRYISSIASHVVNVDWTWKASFIFKGVVSSLVELHANYFCSIRVIERILFTAPYLFHQKRRWDNKRTEDGKIVKKLAIKWWHKEIYVHWQSKPEWFSINDAKFSQPSIRNILEKKNHNRERIKWSLVPFYYCRCCEFCCFIFSSLWAFRTRKLFLPFCSIFNQHSVIWCNKKYKQSPCIARS